MSLTWDTASLFLSKKIVESEAKATTLLQAHLIYSTFLLSSLVLLSAAAAALGLGH